MPNPSTIWKRVLHAAHRAGFTQNEAGVIVFLAAALVAGGVIQTLRGSEADTSHRPAGRDVRSALAAQDSVFAARSTQPAAEPSSNLGSDTTPLSSDAEDLQGSSQPSGRIDINRAAEIDLQRLPGIGPATAKKIVAFRGEHGPFARIEDVMRVKSIGPKKFEKIRQFIKVE